MGFHGMSLGSLILLLAIVFFVFGTKKLRHMGEDLGAAFKGFRKGLREEPVSKEDERK
jgi:sec-independent protein translocase protein TatA